MRRPRTILTGTVIALLGVAALTGCGDTTSDERSSDQPAGDCTTDRGATVAVEIPEFVFSPTPVAISACDSVVWKNTHTQAHTSTGNGDQTWTTGNLAPDAESEPVLFEESGTFTYICALHPFMKGTVEVS